MKNFKKVKPFLEEMGELIGKHNLSMIELMKILSSFLAFSAARSPEPLEFMQMHIALMKEELLKHVKETNEKTT